MLKVGTHYTVIAKNLILPYPAAPETSSYSGFILPSAKYDPPENIRMSTGIRDFPIRIIRKDLIIKIGDQDVCYKSKTTKDSVRLVEGSKGMVYTVTTQNGRSSCTCIGFQFRKSCKHIEETAA